MKKVSNIPVSLLIPCKNEEVNLDRCIKSVDWADEIFVVDSQSSDKTPEIAQKHGAKVVQFKYQGGWPKKKNWALENLPFSNEWVLILDADECDQNQQRCGSGLTLLDLLKACVQLDSGPMFPNNV